MLTAAFPPGWRIVTAETVGPDHLARGVENQDAHAYRRLGDGFAMAVADGAGSSQWSAWGSRTAVDTACQVARDIVGSAPPDRSAWWGLGQRYASGVLRRFDERVAAQAADGSAPTDFATTLLALVAHPPAFLFVSLGDGFAVVERDGGGAHLVVPPDSGPDDGAAVFLTSAGRDLALRVELLVDPGVRGVALCTDGLVEAVLAADSWPGGGRRLRAPEEFCRYFAAFAGGVHDPGILTDQMRSEAFAATSLDDKTMVLAVRT